VRRSSRFQLAVHTAPLVVLLAIAVVASACGSSITAVRVGNSTLDRDGVADLVAEVTGRPADGTIDAAATAEVVNRFVYYEALVDLQQADALEAVWPADVTHIVANLPYQISSPVLERIQRHHAEHPMAVVVLLLQEEFADRMAIGRDRAALSPLGLSLWLDFEVELDAKVPPHSFSPSPRVSSRLTSMRPVDREPGIDRRMFRTVIQHCFANRRRKLRTLLSKPPSRIGRIKGWHKQRWSEAVDTVIQASPEGLPEGWLDLRPENLETSQWVSLVDAISSN